MFWRRYQRVQVFAPVLLGLSVFCLLTRGELAFDENSIAYWSAANNFINHGQFGTGIAFELYPGVALATTLAQGHLTVLHPMAAYAPLYAVSIAFVAECLGTSAVQAAFVVNAFSIAAILLLVGWLAGGGVTGCLTASVLAMMPFFLSIARVLSSETLFTALILAGLTCLTLWVERGDRVGFLYVACLFGVAAAYTRYIGVTFFILVAVVVTSRIVVRRSSWHHVAAMGLYAALMLPLAAHNVQATGYMSGAARPRSDIGVVSNMSSLLHATFDALPLFRTVAAGPFDVIASLILLAIVTVSAVDFRKLNTRLVWGSATSVRMAALFAIVYCSLLVALRSYTAFEVIHIRFLFPALVTAAIPLGATLRLTLHRNRRVAVAVLWAVMALATTSIDRFFDPGPYAINGIRVQHQPSIEAARVLIRDLPQRSRVILSDDIASVHYAAATPVYAIPPLGTLRRTLSRIRSIAPDTDIVIVIGPPSPRSSLETDEKEYAQLLDDLAVCVLRGADHGVWYIPSTDIVH